MAGRLSMVYARSDSQTLRRAIGCSRAVSSAA
nr:MAG TPA: hypothetical protein [Caudoviricetes sp.]